MENLATFIGGSSIIAFVLLQLLKKWIKNNILPRWGDLGVQAVLLALAFVLATITYYWTKLPVPILETTAKIFTGTILIYNVFWKTIIKKTLLGKLDSDDK